LGFCLVMGAAPGQADEIFSCADGSSVTLESGNREAMQDHPCVKAWFVAERARQQALSADEGGRGSEKAGPTLHRHPVLRAMALRDLRKRPAYLARTQTRTVNVRAYARSDGTLVKAHLRSPPSEGSRATFRVRFRRR
jgi:hypothetical protein